MRGRLWPPALLGPWVGGVSLPLASRSGGEAGSDRDVGLCLEHRWAGAFEALGSECLSFADEEWVNFGCGEWRPGSALGLAAVAAEGLVVDVEESTGGLVVGARSPDELHEVFPVAGVGARLMWCGPGSRPFWSRGIVRFVRLRRKSGMLLLGTVILFRPAEGWIVA